MTHWDAIVIGSGFGGAVTACRLAERNMRVLVLERGRRWDPGNYPRQPADPWIWDQENPALLNGWLDLRIMDSMWIAQGAGVGGGSLIYASVSIEAQPWVFEQGWPEEITFAELAPYYARVGKMLGVQELPDGQLTERFKVMRDAARNLGYASRFRKVPLAVSFDPDYSFDRPDPCGVHHTHTTVNEHGKAQGTCVHCGNCDIGCPVQAKNTLDLNYLARAEKFEAEIRPLHIARAIEPADHGYTVRFDQITASGLVAGSASAARVIVACGSLGSTELLLRCRDDGGTLPAISPALGAGWSSNGDFLTPAVYKGRRISPTIGPTITCAIDFLDAHEKGKRFFVEDGGFPNVIVDFLAAQQKTPSANYLLLLQWLQHFHSVQDPIDGVMPWFGQSEDAADGRLRLGRTWPPWRKKLKLDWAPTKSKATIDAMIGMHERLSAATGGKAMVPSTWKDLGLLITPHPLGGCRMGRSRDDGVVDHRGEVFGYPGLYVADGAIIPKALGLNPSRTIAALAERIAEKI